MILVFLGPPGVGKGTIGEKIHYDVISTGDISRRELKKPKYKELKKKVDRGQFVPDDIMLGFLKKEIKGRKNFALDGFPRTIPQAKALDKYMHVDKVLYLTAPERVLVERISGRRIGSNGKVYHIKNNPPPHTVKVHQRKDDCTEVVKKRLEVYKEITHPLVDYYKKQKKLVRINANRPIPDVVHSVLKAIRQR